MQSRYNITFPNARRASNGEDPLSTHLLPVALLVYQELVHAQTS